MATRPDPSSPANRPGSSTPSSPARITVYELFPRYIQLLAGLPGEVSQFEETGFGYEWRCEYRLGAVQSAGGTGNGNAEFQLHFSLVDLRGGTRPAAVLYLVEEGPADDSPQRQMLPLEDLTETQEVLNRALAHRGATVGIMEGADRFLRQLGPVRDGLGQDVDWVSTPE
jgi:hypothetical protein